MKRQQAVLSGPRDLRQQFRVPPDVIDIERDAEDAGAGGIEPVADIERLFCRIDAGAVGGCTSPAGTTRGALARQARSCSTESDPRKPSRAGDHCPAALAASISAPRSISATRA